jgi:hypothetical protein
MEGGPRSSFKHTFSAKFFPRKLLRSMHFWTVIDILHRVFDVHSNQSHLCFVFHEFPRDLYSCFTKYLLLCSLVHMQRLMYRTVDCALSFLRNLINSAIKIYCLLTVNFVILYYIDFR